MIECPKCKHLVADDAKFCGNCAAPIHPEVIQSEAVVPQAEEVDPFVGKCIDNKYYITERIASGGMGVVYLAMQKGVGQEVAIKKLHSMYYQNPTIVERFINEARSYGKISHPNAVKLHDLLNVNGQICIVMEYVKGRTLTQFLQSGYLFSIRQIIDISLQLADALGTVNQAGIIHRDLKTENVMLLETVPGRFSVKILDFGIAKFLDKPPQQSTEAGLIVGTPEFMAPEQCYGHPVDNRVDIYAFGVLMYAMICGKLPFTAESQMAVMQMQISAPVPTMVRPDKSEVHPGLEAIVLKCMMKAPDDRYSSFTEVIVDLECLQEGKQTRIAVSGEFAVAEEDEDDSEDTSVWETAEEPPILKPDVVSMTPQALKSRLESAVKVNLTSPKSIMADQDKDEKPASKKSLKAIEPVENKAMAEEESETQDNEAFSSDAIKMMAESHKKPEEPSGEVDSVTKDLSEHAGVLERHDSMEFSIDESDELPVNAKSSDKSGDGLSLGDEDDEGFSLGDLDINPEHSKAKITVIESPAVKKAKSRALVIISVFALVIVLAGAILWFLGDHGYIDLTGVREWTGAVFPNDGEKIEVVTDDTDGTGKTDVDKNPTEETTAGDSAGAGDNTEIEPDDAPVEASRVVARDNIDRGVLRTIMEYAKVQSMGGSVEEADGLLASIEKQKSLLSVDEQTAYQELVTLNDSFKNALAQAERARKNKNCETIQTLISELPEDAVVIREQLEKSRKSCNAVLAAPPTTLMD